MAKEALVDLANETGQTALRSFATAVVSRVVASWSADRKKRRPKPSALIESLVGNGDSEALGAAVADAYTWASAIHVQGMPTAVDTGAHTVALQMAAVARRFRGSTFGEELDESTLLDEPDSFLVLGDPGAGKTTTLKRLVLTLFDDLPSPPSAERPAIPVVVLCRDIDWTTTDLEVLVAQRLGVPIERVLRALELGNDDVPWLVAELLDQSDCLLLVDGLDEIPDTTQRHRVLRSLERLHRQVRTARVICSCRSGDAPHLEGFRTAELLPLTSQQWAEIATRRLKDGDAFLDRIASSNVDPNLLDRPLFLNHLMLIFERTGDIPDRPVDLYRQLVRLIVHEWDEQRRVRRLSAYGRFDPATKQEVLQELAYQFTWRGLATFDESELLDAFAEVGPTFELPANQAQRIVREIESHAGLIVENQSGFQFSHYTLQEYLCAENIIRRPADPEVNEFLRRSPEVAAVAVSLSTRPTAWALERFGSGTPFEAPTFVPVFLHRLAQERPRFEESPRLGELLLRLMTDCSATHVSVWSRLGASTALQRSVLLAVEHFHVTRRGSVVEFARRRERDEADQRKRATYKVESVLYEAIVPQRN